MLLEKHGSLEFRLKCQDETFKSFSLIVCFVALEDQMVTFTASRNLFTVTMMRASAAANSHISEARTRIYLFVLDERFTA